MKHADNAPAAALTTPSSFYRRIPQFVIEDRELHFISQHLFVVIAHAVNLRTNRVQMTIEQLADKARIAPSSVLRYLPALEKQGYILVERAGKGTKIPNVYHLAGEAARIVCGTLPAEQPSGRPSSSQEQPPDRPLSSEQPSVGQSSSQEQPPDRPSNALTDSRQPADGFPTDTRTAVPEPPVRASRQSARPITKQEALKDQIHTKEAVVVDDQLPPIFEVKGVKPQLIQTWIDSYGETRVWEVLQAMQKQKHVGNQGGWVNSALKNGWQFGRERKNEPQDDPFPDGSRFFTGPYADLIRR